MVCIIQMGNAGSSMATPMLAKQREPGETVLSGTRATKKPRLSQPKEAFSAYLQLPGYKGL